jgi:hypothetical protein
MAEAGKGSQRRDSDASLYANNWEIIFGKKEEIPVQIESKKEHPCGNDCSKCGCTKLYKSS